VFELRRIEREGSDRRGVFVCYCWRVCVGLGQKNWISVF